MKATEIYAQTGEVIERDFTEAELEQREKDQQEYAAAEAAKQAEAEAKETQRQVILDRLGLTADEARLLLGS
jgi:hypothetical protein